MGLGGVAIAVPPYVIHPKTAVLGRAGGGSGMIFPFSLLFNSLFLILLTFSQEKPDFSQNCGFFGEVVGKRLFCLLFRSTFASSKKQDNAEMVWCS